MKRTPMNTMISSFSLPFCPQLFCFFIQLIQIISSHLTDLTRGVSSSHLFWLFDLFLPFSRCCYVCTYT